MLFALVAVITLVAMIIIVENFFYYFSVIRIRDVENRDYIDIYSIPFAVAVVRLCSIYLVIVKSADVPQALSMLKPEKGIKVKYNRTITEIKRIDDPYEWQTTLAKSLIRDYEFGKTTAVFISGTHWVGKRSVAYVLADMLQCGGVDPLVIDYNTSNTTNIMHDVWAICQRDPTRSDPVILLIRDYDQIANKLDPAVYEILHRVPHVFIIATSTTPMKSTPVNYRHFMRHFKV